MSYGLIYVIENTLNGKCYVGQTTQGLKQRFREHLNDNRGYCRVLCNALRKYGKENFRVFEISEGRDKDDLDYLEKVWIMLFDSIATGYNLKSGGYKGLPSEETKIRLRLAQANRPPQSTETRQKRSRSILNMDPADKLARGQKISLALKGKAKSAEHRAALSLSKTGKSMARTNEHNQKISAALKGKPKTDQHILNNKEARRLSRQKRHAALSAAGGK
jgi:group I intron endonuclease